MKPRSFGWSLRDPSFYLVLIVNCESLSSLSRVWSRSIWDFCSSVRVCKSVRCVTGWVYMSTHIWEWTLRMYFNKGRILLGCCVSIDQRCVCVCVPCVALPFTQSSGQHAGITPAGFTTPHNTPQLPQCISISKLNIPGDCALTVRSFLSGSDTPPAGAQLPQCTEVAPIEMHTMCLLVMEAASVHLSVCS